MNNLFSENGQKDCALLVHLTQKEVACYIYTCALLNASGADVWEGLFTAVRFLQQLLIIIYIDLYASVALQDKVLP